MPGMSGEFPDQRKLIPPAQLQQQRGDAAAVSLIVECGLMRLLQFVEVVTPPCPPASDSLKRIIKLVQFVGSLTGTFSIIIIRTYNTGFH